MKTYNNIFNEYVAPVDLETLGNTFNTLEQGHQAAVKAASDLEAAVAQLDMNEDEDGFKQQLIGEIQDTIDNNTIYGNAYGALDNLVAKAGNIQSDGRVIGRLRNQKAKKEYDAKVDAMAIPDGMKQMYKEENPYYYEDGNVDERTGRVLPGELWKPITNPVTTVPDIEIQKYALQIAAKEAGGGERISFLDANGNETYDPAKSADGAFYRKVGTKYERLTEDKIRKAYQVAIDSIPGARESLAQDYKYETYQYNKLVDDAIQKGGDTTPYIPGYTDKNGNIYSEEQWLNNKINNFADVAAYNHSYTTVNFGDALENRRKIQASAAAASQYGSNPNFFGANNLGTYEVEQNAYSSALNARNNASKSGLDIINKIASGKFGDMNLGEIQRKLIREKKATGPGTAAQYIIQTYGKDLTPLERTNLSNAFFTYWKTNTQINDMIKKAGGDADALRFSDNINSQEYTNDNKYGKAIIRELNTTFEINNQVDYEIGKDVFDAVTRLYGVKNLNEVGLSYTQNSNGTYTVSFTPNNRNLMPKFDSYIQKADDQVGGSFGGWAKKTFTGNAASGNYVVKFQRKSGKTDVRNIGDGMLAVLYERGENAAGKIQDKIGGFKGTKNILGTDLTTPGEAYYMEIGQQLGWTGSEIRAQQKACKERVDRSIANGNLAGGQVYLIGDPDKIDSPRQFNKQVTNATELNLLLQHMYSVDPNNITRTYSAGDDNIPEGYYFSFTVPENDKNAVTSGYRGKTINMYVTGSVDDGSGYRINNNPRYVAQNFVGTSKATGAPIENFGYSNALGDTRLIPNNDGTYESNIIGRNITLNEQQAEVVTEQLLRLEQMKMQIPNLALNPQLTATQKRELLQNHIDSYAMNLGNTLGISPEVIAVAIANYFNEPTN